MPEADDAIREFAKLYFQIKKEIFQAEKYTRITSPRVLVALRNALDDLMVTVSTSAHGGDKPREMERHLWRAAYDAWLDAAGIQIQKLESRLGSIGVGGRIDEATGLLDIARTQIAEARTLFSSDSDRAVETARNSAVNASKGLSLLQVSPRILKIGIVLTAIGVLVAVISLLVALFLK